MTPTIISPPRSAPAPGRPPATAAARPVVAARRYAGLDGLRAFAVSVVLVYHLFPGVLPGGFIGVDVFFVISGFLITSLLLREHTGTGRIDLRRFWVRRARRLVPAIVVLVLVCSSAALLIGGDVLVGLGRQVLGAATFSANWLSIAAHASYFSQDSPELFRHLWSLAVEEQFYLLWPLVLVALALVRPWWARLAIVSTVAVASALAMALLYTPGGDPTRVYFGSDTHSFGLAAGAALAIIVARIRPVDLDAGESTLQVFVRRWLPGLGLLSLGGLLAAAIAMHDDAAFTYRGGLALVTVLSVLAIWAAVSSGSRLGRLLELRPLRYVGARSYGLYLWHWPVFILVCALVPDEHDPVMAPLVGIGSLAIAVAATLLSYRSIELPIRRHGMRGVVRYAAQRMRASSAGRARGIATAAATALLAAATVAAIALAPAATGAQTFIENGRAALQKPSAAPSAMPTHPLPAPTPHPVAAGPEISAFGDSVMLASAPALQESFPGIAVDAVVSRQMNAIPDLVRTADAAGALRRVVVVGLGTNGPISPDTLETLRRAVGPARQLVLVTVQAPRSWTPGVNATLGAFAAAHPEQVALEDWQAAIAPRLDLLADDQIHPGMSGGRVYAEALHAALVRLSEVAPAPVGHPWDRIDTGSR
ncbi:acyltransferase family protein [Leifsonia poae]|uniref:acyltransferase family protein n=1 Tax=Leifsonia poae TaxID=110933 RepID=UPI001CC0292E|nr:acyltransferase family protein [Leifsonia poae]